MPIAISQDAKGSYFHLGASGAHYYFTPSSTRSVKSAYSKAVKQMKAIYANGYKGK